MSISDLASLALLDEPTRRRLFDYVRTRSEAVGRVEAATAVGISRSLAAFHLDRLVEGGLLEPIYRRISGRAGRGAGRPAKLYRATARRIAVNVPETRYELAGQILARAFEQGRQSDGVESIRRAARIRGREMGHVLATELGGTSGLPEAAAVLAEVGFEPRVDRSAGVVRLENCPFHALVEQSRPTVCALNGALVAGLLDGAGIEGVRVEPDGEAGTCCVRLRARRPHS
jgi:predicted ArsR family transcriptional regulator